MRHSAEVRSWNPKLIRGLRRKSTWVGCGVVLLLVVIGVSVWLGVRAYLAQKEVAECERLAKAAQSALAAGEVDQAKASAKLLASHIDAAEGYVDDPIWWSAGRLPLIGTNFSTASQLVTVLSDVVHGAVLPLADVAGSVGPNAIRPSHGRLDLQAISDAHPVVDHASAVLQEAAKQVALVRVGAGGLPQLREGVDRVKTLLNQTAEQVSVADKATSILPTMLGDAGPRTYLVLFQNNAELRASGGIPGAVAEVQVDNGHIVLGRQAEAKDFPKFPNPVLPLADQTKGLYGPITGQYFQDVNLVPQFPLAASLAAEMWKRQYGDQVDGVISLDPVVLSYLLKATGPVKLSTGESLDSTNAVQLLLSDAYAKYTGTGKDDFFAAAAAAVFARVANGGFEPKPMVDALGRAVEEHRLLAWSPKEGEEEALEAAGMSGSLPSQTPAHGVFGVYLNDATGSKMDYYLKESYGIGGVLCRADGRPTWEVEVTLTSTAPADAATSLPDYVTGAGSYGVKPGDVKTQVNVYAPPSAIYMAAWKNSLPLDVHRDMDSGHPVAQTNVELAPGQSATLRFQFLGAPQADQHPDLISTPLIDNPSPAVLALSCPGVAH